MSTRPPHLAGIDSLLRPQSVAVLGASAKRAADGNAALANLRRQGFPESELHLVHPSADVIDGLPVTPDIAALPHGLDTALVSLPGAAVLETLKALEAVGCRSALVPSAGLDALQTRQLAAFAASSAMAVHGNNCMGVLNITDGIPLWFYDGILTEHARGRISLVSQSGSATFLSRATEETGFAKIISTGNEIGLTTADYLTWLATDPATEGVGLVLESIKDVAAFTEGVRALREAGKPVIALKVGRTALGARASMAHTGALLGGDEAYRALFERLDVPLVNDYDELAVSLQLLATSGVPAARGNRVAVITDSGGEAGLTADLAKRYPVRLTPFTPDTSKRIAELMPETAVNNPFDAGASPSADDEAYNLSYEIAARDENVDSVMVVMEAHATLTEPELAYAADIGLAIQAATRAGKPVVVANSSAANTHPRFRDFVGPGVAVLRGIGPSFTALAASARNRRPVPGPTQRPDDLPTPDRVDELRAETAAHQGPLPDDLTRRLLTAYGIPLVAAVTVTDPDQAVDWAEGRYPVVAKISSPDIPHRSDVGGVAVGLTDATALRTALKDIAESVATARPDARISGFEIQEQVTDSHEAMLGWAADPVFGAVPTVGSGGVLVELDADTASGLAPLTPAEARGCIDRTRMARLLTGYRNLHPFTALGSLADALHRLSWLAADFRDLIDEADLNPTLVAYGAGRVRVVDALLVARTVSDEAGRADSVEGTDR
ncbi:acetate--CoA ligase family protein [Streptomyces sp. NPDC002088]|uniref:acetate--CoA ligase family protein n=1 Tax=Streptomyces sp. NPDC002088 TaxID=3154665 RepID=UPI00332B5E5C